MDFPDLGCGQKVKLSFQGVPFGINIIIPCVTPSLLEISHFDPIGYLYFGELKRACYSQAPQ